MRLIDTDALKYDFGELYDQEHNRRCWDLYVTNEAIAEQPTIDAIPIEFIQKRIDQLKEMNERIFIANGGYTSPSDYEQWELERLVREWREEHDTAD